MGCCLASSWSPRSGPDSHDPPNAVIFEGLRTPNSVSLADEPHCLHTFSALQLKASCKGLRLSILLPFLPCFVYFSFLTKKNPQVQKDCTLFVCLLVCLIQVLPYHGSWHMFYGSHSFVCLFKSLIMLPVHKMQGNREPSPCM